MGRTKLLHSLLAGIILMVLPTFLLAQSVTMRQVSSGDCSVTACTAASPLYCQQGPTTLFSCNTATGFYVAVASGGGGAFSGISSGTNTTATMTVGSGASILTSGTGVITATQMIGSGSTTNAVDLATAEAAGTLPITKGGTGATSTTAGRVIVGGAAGLSLTTDAELTYSTSTNVLTIASGGLVEPNKTVIEICPVGCEYATLNAACAAETSTAANPLTYHVQATAYTATNTMCSGEDHVKFVGDGIGVTILQGVDNGFGEGNGSLDCTASPKECKGALNLGTSTNVEVSGMTLKGNRGIWWAAATVGGTWAYIHDVEQVQTTTNGDEDCFFLDRAANPTEIHYKNNICRGRTDWFTLNQSDGVTVDSEGNYFTNTSAGTMVSGGGFIFRAIPCSFTSIGDVMDVPAFSNSGAITFPGYDFLGTDATSCSTTATAKIIAPRVLLANTNSAGTGAVVYGVYVDASATELATVEVVAPHFRISTTDNTAGAAYGVLQKTQATTQMSVSGGYIKASGGQASATYDVAASPSDGSVLIGVAGLTFGGSEPGTSSITGRDVKYLNVGRIASLPATTTMTRTSGQSTPTINVSGGNLEGGLIVDNTDTGVTETSPWIKQCTGETSERCWRYYVDTSTNPRMIFEDGSTERLHMASNDFQFTGAANANWRFNNTGGFLFLGAGGSDDNLGLRFNSANTGDIRWRNSTKRFELQGNNAFSIGQGSDLTVGTCVAGDYAYDTGGATKEVCFCFSTNVWGCWKPDGTFTANGPAD